MSTCNITSFSLVKNLYRFPRFIDPFPFFLIKISNYRFLSSPKSKITRFRIEIFESIILNLRDASQSQQSQTATILKSCFAYLSYLFKGSRFHSRASRKGGIADCRSVAKGNCYSLGTSRKSRCTDLFDCIKLYFSTQRNMASIYNRLLLNIL